MDTITVKEFNELLKSIDNIRDSRVVSTYSTTTNDSYGMGDTMARTVYAINIGGKEIYLELMHKRDSYGSSDLESIQIVEPITTTDTQYRAV